MAQENVGKQMLDEANVYDEKIGEIEDVDLFEIFLSSSSKFKDIMELRKFISYLKENKTDVVLKEFNLEKGLEEFRQR